MENQNITSLKYADLQKLAKKCGIKANMKCEKLRSALLTYFEDESTSLEMHTKDSDKKPGMSECLKSTLTVTSKLSVKDKNEGSTIKSAAQVSASRRCRIEKPQRKQSLNTPNHTALNLIEIPRKNTSEKKLPKHLRRSTYDKLDSTLTTPKLVDGTSPKNEKCEKPKRVRSTVTTPSATSNDSRKRIKKRTFDKDQTTSFNIIDNLNAVDIDTPKRHSRKRTFNKEECMKTSEQKRGVHSYINEEKELFSGLISEDDSSISENEDPSPGVKSVINKMTSEMSNDEMKACLLDVLDKRAQKTQKVDGNENLSMIPRYMVASSQGTRSLKPTPSNKLKKLHKKEFSKMESIDAYLERKRKRNESLTTSMKKMKVMTERMRNVVESVKKYRTPPSLLKTEPKIRQVKAKGALFLSPAQKATFKPSVMSTTHASFNFAGTKSPPSTFKAKAVRAIPIPTLNARAPSLKTPNHKKVVSSASNFCGRRSPRHSLSVKKDLSSKIVDVKENKHLTTPRNAQAKQPVNIKSGCGNKSQLNMSVNSKAKFDLQASLARPITWQAHKGKLQDFKFGAVPSSSYNRTSVAKTRENNRKTVQTKQADKRLQMQMKRRGIVV